MCCEVVGVCEKGFVPYFLPIDGHLFQAVSSGDLSVVK